MGGHAHEALGRQQSRQRSFRWAYSVKNRAYPGSLRREKFNLRKRVRARVVRRRDRRRSQDSGTGRPDVRDGGCRWIWTLLGWVAEHAHDVLSGQLCGRTQLTQRRLRSVRPGVNDGKVQPEARTINFLLGFAKLGFGQLDANEGIVGCWIGVVLHDWMMIVDGLRPQAVVRSRPSTLARSSPGKSPAT